MFISYIWFVRYGAGFMWSLFIIQHKTPKHSSFCALFELKLPNKKEHFQVARVVFLEVARVVFFQVARVVFLEVARIVFFSGGQGWIGTFVDWLQSTRKVVVGNARNWTQYLQSSNLHCFSNAQFAKKCATFDKIVSYQQLDVYMTYFPPQVRSSVKECFQHLLNRWWILAMKIHFKTCVRPQKTKKHAKAGRCMTYFPAQVRSPARDCFQKQRLRRQLWRLTQQGQPLQACTQRISRKLKTRRFREINTRRTNWKLQTQTLVLASSTSRYSRQQTDKETIRKWKWN